MTDTLNFPVIREDEPFELRRYPAHIKAEVDVADSSYQKAIYQGFSILAGYIFGDNIDTEKIFMTSPVQVTHPEKIEMTKPVTVRGEGTYTVAFFMPQKYSMQTLPKTKDPRINLTEIGSAVMAAHRFTGYFSENKVRKAKQRLGDWVAQEGLEGREILSLPGTIRPGCPGFSLETKC